MAATKSKKPRARHAESARKGTPERERTRKMLPVRLSPETRTKLEALALERGVALSALAATLIEAGLAGT